MCLYIFFVHWFISFFVFCFVICFLVCSVSVAADYLLYFSLLKVLVFLWCYCGHKLHSLVYFGECFQQCVFYFEFMDFELFYFMIRGGCCIHESLLF